MPLVPTRCLHYHEVGTQLLQTTCKCVYTRLVLRATPTLITRTHRDVEPLLGNIDPDEHFLSIGHVIPPWPILADAGLHLPRQLFGL